MNPFGSVHVKVIALAVKDPERAKAFYTKTLELFEDHEATDDVSYRLGGGTVIILREGYTPVSDPNPRITLQVLDARQTEKDLVAKNVTISDPVQLYKERFYVGAFLDSEGNKLWFCSYA